MAAGQLFGSAPRARMGRGKRRRTAWQRRPGGWRRHEREVGDDPGDGPNGPSALGPKADGADFGGIQKNGGGPHEGMGRNQRIKKNELCKWF
jgi:hypothetical protein